MSPDPHNATDIRAIEAKLASTARMLWLRQVARALPVAVTAAGLVACGALVLAVLLPRALFGGGLVSAPTAIVAGLVGGLAALVWQMRTLRLPSLVDAALTLEARLPKQDASLATLMQAAEEFRAPIIRRAEAELAAALVAPRPNLFSTRGLLAMPLAVIGAVTLAALCWQTPLAQASDLLGQPDAPKSTGLGTINVAAGRDAADAKARAEAMGLQKAAKELGDAARALRTAANQQDANAALDKARKAMGDAKGVTPTLDLPPTAPSEAAARARLADEMEAAAGGVRRAAEAKAAGTGGEGGSNSAADTNPESRFVAFPRLSWQASGEAGSSDLAGQSPARRALAERASR